MGIICELYRIPDTEIEELEKLNTDEIEEYLNEKFAWVDSKYHKQNDTVFSLDKGWSITSFLIQECDDTPNKILKKLDNLFIKSPEVKEMNRLLESITIDDLKSKYNQEKLIKNYVYRAKMKVNWEYINYHLELYKSGFKKAAEHKNGIAISYG